jgi:hypothetical protein
MVIEFAIVDTGLEADPERASTLKLVAEEGRPRFFDEPGTGHPASAAGCTRSCRLSSLAPTP